METPNRGPRAATQRQLQRRSLGGRVDDDDRFGGRAVHHVDHVIPGGLALATAPGEASKDLANVESYMLTCEESGVPARPLYTLITNEKEKARWRVMAQFFKLNPPAAPGQIPDEMMVAVLTALEGRSRGEMSFSQVLAHVDKPKPGAGGIAYVAFLGEVEHQYSLKNAMVSLGQLPNNKMRANIAELLDAVPERERDMLRMAAMLTEREVALSNWAAFKAVVFDCDKSLDLVPMQARARVPALTETSRGDGVPDRARAGPRTASAPAANRGALSSVPARPVTCYGCGNTGHKSFECPNTTRAPAVTPASTPGTWPSRGRFPDTKDAGFVNQRRGGGGGGGGTGPGATPKTAQSLIRVVTVLDADTDADPRAVRVEINDCSFGATPDTAMVGEADVLMGRGAFERLCLSGVLPELRGSALYEDVNGRVTGASVYAVRVTLPDLAGGPFSDSASLIVPDLGGRADETVLLSQPLLERAGVNVYDAFRPSRAVGGRGDTS